MVGILERGRTAGLLEPARTIEHRDRTRVPGGTMEAMVGVLVVLFLLVPLAELYVIIQVGQSIGALNTVGLLLLDSLVGGWLMKREGLAVFRRLQAQLEAGNVPGKELVDAFLILFGGALMLAPGFLTDLVGMALLLPPVRAVVRRVLARRFKTMAVHRTGMGPSGPRSGGRSDVIDLP